MNLFQLLDTLGGPVRPDNCKFHFASWNGSEHPVDVYLRGEFVRWQNWQSRRNFSSREFVVALTQIPGEMRWLFVGCYRRLGKSVPDGDGHIYDLEPVSNYEELEGRLVVRCVKPFRNSYPYGETITESTVLELREERMSVSEFNGFKNVLLPFKSLESIVRRQEPTWRAALSSVAGVYVISDPGAGKLYVGSAYGVDGIWGRWSQYIDGHGHNTMLKELVTAEGVQRAAHFRFAVLETADIDSLPKDVIERENHWKDVLLTRQVGYNASEGPRSRSE